MREDEASAAGRLKDFLEEVAETARSSGKSASPQAWKGGRAFQAVGIACAKAQSHNGPRTFKTRRNQMPPELFL